MKRFGFSLAEVLITLGVIGVVAALTIPSLHANYQKKQYATALKKDYATLTQMFKRIAEDEDAEDFLSTELGEVLSNPSSNIHNFKSYVNKYFPNAKVALSIRSYKKLNNHSYWTTFHVPHHYSAIDLPDASIYFGRPTYSYSYDNSSGDSNSGYGYVYIDVNGWNKGPNAMGRDLFGFQYDSKGKFETTGNKNNCVNSSPVGCFEKVMDDGWEIKYY